jgi:phosphoribosylglycinamide formyltransferase-1
LERPEAAGILRPVKTSVAVLASGTGSNLQALMDHPRVGPALRLVVSDRAEAKALDRARSAGVEAVHLDPASFDGREDHDAALTSLLRDRGVDVVCLAGYMRLLSPVVVRPFWGRMLNVHPSLLPAFPGAHAVRDALEWGAKVTGCTVHFVDEEVDHGPIVAQEAVPILEDDDEASLHARIQEVEHSLYPVATAFVLDGRIRLEGRRARIVEGG